MDYEKILNHMVTPNPLIQMSLTFNSKGKTYEAQLPITSQTPKAAQSYVEYTNEMCIQNNSSEMNQVKEILENLSAGHSVSLSKHESLSIDIVNASIEDNNVMESQNNTTVVGNQYNDTLIWDSSNQEIIDKCITALEEKNAKKQFNMNAPIYRITYTNYDKEDNNRMEYYVQ